MPTPPTLPTLPTLPYELRAQTLRLSLFVGCPRELQLPLMIRPRQFVRPLFHVCRGLRDESLDAFYEVNIFLWIVDVENPRWSDPVGYHLDANDVDMMLSSEGSWPLTPCLPWEFPRLMRRLRRVKMVVFLPRNSNAVDALQLRLRAVVRALDYGRRLEELSVVVSARGGRPYDESLTPEEKLALDELAVMKVRGKMLVGTEELIWAVGVDVRRWCERRGVGHFSLYRNFDDEAAQEVRWTRYREESKR